jgi:hypothetical protein
MSIIENVKNIKGLRHRKPSLDHPRQAKYGNKEGPRTPAKENPQRAKIFAPGEVAVGKRCLQPGDAHKQALQSI